eukprot:jgi/Botrbrau1/12905/Bobra.0299s0019.5
MLRGFFRESFEDTILIRNIEGEILRNIIQSHYTHKITLDMHSVKQVCGFAHCMELAEVLQACKTYLETTLNTDTAILYWQIFDLYGIGEAELVASFIAKNLPAVAASGTLGNLSSEFLLQLLMRDDLYISSELELFGIIQTWKECQDGGHDWPPYSAHPGTFPKDLDFSHSNSMEGGLQANLTTPQPSTPIFGSPDAAMAVLAHELPASGQQPCFRRSGTHEISSPPEGVFLSHHLQCQHEHMVYMQDVSQELLGAFRPEVMKAEELVVLHHVAVACGATDVLASLGQLLLRRLPQSIGNCCLGRSLWPTHVIHRKGYSALVTLRMGLHVAWQGRSVRFEDSLGNVWEVEVTREGGSWRPVIVLRSCALRPPWISVEASYVLDLFFGSLQPQAEKWAGFSGTCFMGKDRSTGPRCHTLTAEHVRHFANFGGDRGVDVHFAVQVDVTTIKSH